MFEDILGQDMEFNILLGFDGFIDRILKPMKIKTDTAAVPFQTMREFGDYLQGKSGKSCSIDLEAVQVKIGGNMPIVANALGNIGCKAVCVGAMGYPQLHPVFRNMSKNCTLHTVSEPGDCSSLEFGDGKVMLATNTYLDQLNYRTLIERVPEEELVRYFNRCDAAAFLNWGELIHSNDIWENILKHIMPKCRFGQKKKILIDFSDFSKRKKEEVLRMLELLKAYSQYFDIIISLNENELLLFNNKLEPDKGKGGLDEEILALYQWFPCSYFVVHLLDASKYVDNGHVRTIEKEVIQEPKIITGGGDNFNAGLLYGLLLGLQVDDAIRIGSGLSCLYVRDAEEVSFRKLMDYALYYQTEQKEIENGQG